MRRLYIAMLRALADEQFDWDDLARMLVHLDHESAPDRDQDIKDLLSDFYMFVVHGYDAERYEEGIKNKSDLLQRIRVLEDRP